MARGRHWRLPPLGLIELESIVPRTELLARKPPDDEATDSWPGWTSAICASLEVGQPRVEFVGRCLKHVGWKARD